MPARGIHDRQTSHSASPDARPGAYRELAPPAHLRDLVECFWHREAGAARSHGWVLPDGCVDIIWMSGLPPFVAGPATLPARAETAASTEVIGVRFRPGVAHHLVGVDGHELRNMHVPLADIWPHDRAARWDDAMSRPVLGEKLGKIADLISGHLAATDAPDPIVGGMVAWIASHPHRTLDGMVRLSRLSERQILRRFDQAVGYGPKTLQRILRLQRLLWLASAHDRQAPNLTRLAFAAGYADQPHMTRETVALTGQTPRQLLLGAGHDSAVSELFKTIAVQGGTLSLPEERDTELSQQAAD